MQVFISGTDTHVGKTIISSWISLHTGFSYFKPIQTGTREGTDSCTVRQLSNVKIYPEVYAHSEPLSPHLAARMENMTITLETIVLPQEHTLIIEGAGGVLVPINSTLFMIDLIQKLKTPVILVSRTTLGTINHTLLSLEALRARNIPVLGIIMNGEKNTENRNSIEFYGRTPILAEFPILEEINRNTLHNITLPETLKNILEVK